MKYLPPPLTIPDTFDKARQLIEQAKELVECSKVLRQKSQLLIQKTEQLQDRAAQNINSYTVDTQR